MMLQLALLLLLLLKLPLFLSLRTLAKGARAFHPLYCRANTAIGTLQSKATPVIATTSTHGTMGTP